MHPVIEEVLARGFVHLPDVTIDTLVFAESIGTVFRPLADENPIVTMKIEGNDIDKTPYASCRTPALSLHTDYATFPSPPRFTITHCIEPDPEFPGRGVSIVLLLRAAIQHFEKNERALLGLLKSEVFPFCRNAEHELYHSTVPAFAILDVEGRVRFDRTLILPHLDPAGDARKADLIDAVLRFETLCNEHAERFDIALDRHEVLIVDNRRVLHSRNECTVRNEGTRQLSREVNIAFLE